MHQAHNIPWQIIEDNFKFGHPNKHFTPRRTGLTSNGRENMLQELKHFVRKMTEAIETFSSTEREKYPRTFELPLSGKLFSDALLNKYPEYLNEGNQRIENWIAVARSVDLDGKASISYNTGHGNFADVVKILLQENQLEYGANDSGKGKKVVIEYSSPNIVKEFHLGHLRSTIIGAFLANLYKACGWEVISINYLGDWGTQFGMVATGYQKYGTQEEFDEDPLMHLYHIYVKISEEAKDDKKVKEDAARWFRRMEDGDQDAIEQWRSWRELSLKKYKEAYDQLNIKFDLYPGESDVSKGSIDKALAQLAEMGLISQRDNALTVDLKQWLLKEPIIRKRDGASTYLARDIGAAIERYEQYKFDRMIYVVGDTQDFHVAQFFKVLELMDFPWAKNLLHINYGMVQGMSTRKGTAVFLDDIIKEAGLVMHKQMKKKEDKYEAVEDPGTTSLEIAITGIKIQDMAAKRANSYAFNWDRMLSFEGDTGPYLQYAHVRLASIGRNNPHLLPLPPASQIATHTLAQYPDARHIAFLLGTYPEVVRTALKTHEPSGVVTYAFKLAHAISAAWDNVIVKGEEDVEKARAKLYLYECAREVLVAAMRLLSIRPLERM